MAQLPKDKHITYQLQYRKCGKPNCSTCRTGRGHGPSLLGGQESVAQLPKDKHITYQLQYRKCGKPNCSTCRTGRGHGPYWYAYWYEGPRLRSSYIGKILVRQNGSDAPPAAPQAKPDTRRPKKHP